MTSRFSSVSPGSAAATACAAALRAASSATEPVSAMPSPPILIAVSGPTAPVSAAAAASTEVGLTPAGSVAPGVTVSSSTTARPPAWAVGRLDQPGALRHRTDHAGQHDVRAAPGDAEGRRRGGRSRPARRPGPGTGPASGTVATRIPVTPCTVSIARWASAGSIPLMAASRPVSTSPAPGKPAAASASLLTRVSCSSICGRGQQLGQPGQHGRHQHGRAEQWQPRRAAGSIISTVGHWALAIRCSCSPGSVGRRAWGMGGCAPDAPAQRWTTERGTAEQVPPFAVPTVRDG